VSGLLTSNNGFSLMVRAFVAIGHAHSGVIGEAPLAAVVVDAVVVVAGEAVVDVVRGGDAAFLGLELHPAAMSPTTATTKRVLGVVGIGIASTPV
jgi:hypothetical protein